MISRKKKICFITNPYISLNLLRGQWNYWVDNGWVVDCITGCYDLRAVSIDTKGINKIFTVDMQRKPSPVKDLFSLIKIWWILIFNRYNVIHISTPKASFLGAIAGRLSGHSKIFYLLRGRAYENMSGISKSILIFCEKLTCLCASKIITISNEIIDVMSKEKICKRDKMFCIGSGSSAGVDLIRFSPNQDNINKGKAIRHKFSINDKSIVILFVGWIRRDKGINELISAFVELAKSYNHIHLLLVGSYEQTDPLDILTVEQIKGHSRVHHLEWQSEPAFVYNAADIVAFPSYREGFGNVAIEAAAMGLPVVASNIMGCREAVKDSVTGLLVEMGNSRALENGLKTLIDNPELRNKMGTAGRVRIENEFKQEMIFAKTLEILEAMISKTL